MLVLHRPCAPLAAHVDMLWFAARDSSLDQRERNLPTGRLDIVIPLLQDNVLRFDSVDAPAPRVLRGAVVNGAHDRFYVRGAPGQSSVVGVHFRPGGAAAFFGGAVGDLRNRAVPLDELWGPAANVLRERLLDAPLATEKLHLLEDALLSRLATAPPGDAMVKTALGLLQRNPAAARIGDVQAAAGCSPQTFIRRFELAVGLTPKRLARVLRFNTVLAGVAGARAPDWAQLALEAGYFDQSHLGHEFKRLSGLAPGAYVPVAADRPTHVAIAGGLPPALTTGHGKKLQDWPRGRG